MTGEASSNSATPSDVSDPIPDDAKELKSLDTYLKSLPYECESSEEMQEKLRVIVEKLYVCVHTNSWAASVGWDHMLQYWLIMRYPLPHAARVVLAKIYYQLVVSPGSDPRLLGGWADMLGRLIPRKPGLRPKLAPNELELDWRSLWIVLKKRVWASASDADDSLRTDSATYLTVAALASPYFPPSEIPAMLDEMLPLYSFQSATTVITIVTSFLPPYHSHLYLPILFKIWESINSAYIDERMLEISAVLAREHMNKFCPPMDTGEEPWKDVGIFSDSQWARISRSCLVHMNVPVGPRNTSTVSTTGSTADTYQTNRLVKKGPNALSSLPTIFVYSIALDGPIASMESGNDDTGYTAGSKALTSLKTIISSIETYFHPSNHGNWSTNLAIFLSRISSDFATRWHEERQPECQTPIVRRLSTKMKREFVETLKTPSLFAMFSKDPICTAYAQSAIKYLSALEPAIIMPAVLEWSYNGLESVVETHRVTAVLGCLVSVAPMLVSEKRWLGGQKHILPLLELALPGIDINDPTKVCALAFIASVLSEIKIGDLTQAAPLSFGSDTPGDVAMGNVSVDETYRLPDGFEEIDPKLDLEDEQALTRDSSAAFPDWVVAFVRRLFAMFEALPEEGGKSNKTGGKLEETILKSVKSTMDVVFHNLSDQLFDLILGIVYDYAVTTTRANAVRAFGSLISSLTRANPKKVIEKFLPQCAEQIRIELEHGASSIRTTSTGLAIPSDTSLHWHMAILRAIVSNDGSELVTHKAVILNVIKLLVFGTKNERGFSGTSHIIGRILSALTSIYPKDQRFLNRDEWSDPRFCRSHNQQWGKLYRAEDVHIEWHVPSAEEISFAMQILDEIVQPSLSFLNKCLDTPSKDRDAVWRNDFCRMLHVVRSAWGSLSTFISLPSDDAINDPHLDSTTELAILTASSVRMNAGFCVDSPEDPRYSRIIQHRDQFGSFLHRASLALRSTGNDMGEDHIDAILAIIRAIDTFLLDYAMSRTAYATSKKSYEVTRDMVMTNSKQKHFPRNIWVRRAQVYHASRVHTRSLYRRRSQLEELLIIDLLDFSLSSYTRARKNAQAALLESVSYYVRSARLVLDRVLHALEAESKLGKQADPDKQKGALHLLWNRSMCSYAMITPRYVEPYFRAVFTLRTQEKPSVQKLVGRAMDESIGHITAEAMDTSKATFLPSDLTKQTLEDLEAACGQFEPSLLPSLRRMVPRREQLKTQGYDNLRMLAMNAALDTGLHWKYQHWALVLLVQLIRRDEPTSPEKARIFVQYIVSDHPSMRHAAQRGLVKVLRGIKARTFSPNANDLWLNRRQHPLRTEGCFSGMKDFVTRTQTALPHPDAFLVDHTPDGPLIWRQQVQGYKMPPATKSAFSWELSSKDTLAVIREGINADWFAKLIPLWSQEGDRANASTDLRMDNVFLIKQIAKIFEGAHLDSIFSLVDEVLFDTDKFKQRAAAEVLAGLIRGAKHFPGSVSKKLWDWFTPRLPQIFAKLTLDTLTIWQSFINTTCSDRDPRRIQPIVDFISSFKIDFQSESVFPLSKSMDWTLLLAECLGPRFAFKAPALMDLYFENLHTSYAEIRQSIISTFLTIMSDEWRPEFPDSRALLTGCNSQDDPLLVRDARHQTRIMSVMDQLPALRLERLPGANVSQSLYDKIGLTLLSWIWNVAYSPRAPYVFVYTKPILPEIFRMSELQDSAEVQQYSSGVLYIMAAINPPADLIEPLTELFLEAVKTSPSWRVRRKAIPVLAVWYFRNLSSLSPPVVRKIINVLVECLSDENVEVRERAASTLSGILRCRADKEQVILLKDRFARIAQRTRLPKRDDVKYPDALRKLHAAILGMIATLQAYPYAVEPWMPALIERLSRHATDPQPVAPAIRKFAAEFKKTHQDTWHIDKELFDEDQLQALQTIVSGTSYYA